MTKKGELILEFFAFKQNKKAPILEIRTVLFLHNVWITMHEKRERMESK